jgi:hypothetical protein
MIFRQKISHAGLSPDFSFSQVESSSAQAEKNSQEI